MNVSIKASWAAAVASDSGTVPLQSTYPTYFLSTSGSKILLKVELGPSAPMTRSAVVVSWLPPLVSYSISTFSPRS